MHRDTLEFEIMYVKYTIKRLKEMLQELEDRVNSRLVKPYR